MASGSNASSYPEMSGQKSEVINSRFANPVYLPVDMYGVLQYQARQIFLSICHEGLLVHYICQDF